MNLTQNDLIILGIAAIIAVAIWLASRSSIITIKRDLPPDEVRKPRPPQSYTEESKPRKPVSSQKTGYKKSAKNPASAIEPQSMMLFGENILIESRFDGNVTVISVNMGTKIAAPLEIDLRNTSDIFSQLTGLFKNIPKDQLKHYATLIREIKGLLETDANYISLGYNANTVSAEFPLPMSEISPEMREEIAEYLVSIKKKLMAL